MKDAFLLRMILMLPILLVGCQQSRMEQRSALPDTDHVQIAYGEAICAFSKDPIKKVRFGAMARMDNGDMLSFNSVEHLAAFYLQQENPEQIHRMWVTDYNHGKRLIPLEEAIFLHTPNRESPGNLNLLAIEAADERIKFNLHFGFGGELIEWEKVLRLVGEVI